MKRFVRCLPLLFLFALPVYVYADMAPVPEVALYLLPRILLIGAGIALIIIVLRILDKRQKK